jgi:D-threo-aldose 1-dehydrogenase
MVRMRQTTYRDLQTSVLGFGCGSVLGRVGRSGSLRAMHTAFDSGITLFDTARSYGFGRAEGLLGEFLQGRRQQVILATKFGIAPQTQTALKRVALPIARAVLQLPGVRGLFRRGGTGPRTGYGAFSIPILHASVEESLRQLRTDYLDLLFLHDVTEAVLQQTDLFAALDFLVASGKVRHVGLYGSAQIMQSAIASSVNTFTAMQFNGDLFDPRVASITAEPRDRLLIANHPFGNDQRLARFVVLLNQLSTDGTVPAELRAKLQKSDFPIVLEAVLGAILGATHALVFSMMDPAHIRANVAAVEGNRFTPAELALIGQRMSVA